MAAIRSVTWRSVCSGRERVAQTPRGFVVERTTQRVQPRPARPRRLGVYAQTALKWTATGVPVFDRLATLGPGSQSLSMAGQLIAATLVAAYVLKIVADSWAKRMERADNASDLRVSGTRKKTSMVWILIQSVVPVISKMLPPLAMFYSSTVAFSLLAVYETRLRAVFSYTFIDESLVVRSVVMLSQFFQDVVDCLLICSTTLFVRNLKDILVKRYLVKSITHGRFGEAMSSTGVRGNIRPLVRLVDIVNVLLNYLLYLIAFIASLNAFGFDVTPLVASVSGLSVLVGIGMREVLENIAGALTLYLAPPFDIGDRVRFIAADGLDSVQPVVEGVVDEVGMLRTVVVTETSKCSLANALVLRLVVENLTAKKEN